MKYINEFVEKDHVNESYLVTNCTKGTSNNGMPYLSITLQDKTGTIECKKWDAKDEDAQIFVPGNIVNVDLEVILYRNGLQGKILNGTIVPLAGIDVTNFTISAPIPQNELVERLNEFVNSIKDETCKAILESIMNDVYDDFICFPAAIRNHHEYANGLLHHTISMAEMGELVCSHYPQVDRDLLMTGIILHDVGKTIELSGPIIPKYTTQGKLIGHISIMQSMIRETCKKLGIDPTVNEKGLLLEHMILSHHGKQEFGSPVLPLTREAVLLNMIDDMDAKMTILDKALNLVEPGEFTSKVFALDERCFYKPKNSK